jgi:hypothetical protein
MLRRKWQSFRGCWREHRSGVIVDFRICSLCPLEGKDGCKHKCEGYQYGTIIARFVREEWNDEKTVVSFVPIGRASGGM